MQSQTPLSGDYAQRKNIFSLDYTGYKTKITHSEESQDASFSSFSHDSNFTMHQLSLGYEREFLRGSRVSVTPGFWMGFHTGSEVEQDGDSENSLVCKESAQGYSGAAGLSLNFNFYSGNWNTQVFLASRTIQNRTLYFLRYENEGTDARSTEITYDQVRNITEWGIGIRFYNYTKGMFSTFAVNTNQYELQDSLVSAGQGKNTNYKITTEGKTHQDPVSVRIGFGVLF